MIDDWVYTELDNIDSSADSIRRAFEKRDARSCKLEMVAMAISMHGLMEVKGAKSNERLLSMIRGAIPWATDDSETAWCGIFIGYLAGKCGLQRPDLYFRAKEWLGVGDHVDLNHQRVEIGDIVVLSTPTGHHVTMWVRDGFDNEPGLFSALGGNQNDMVDITQYRKDRIVGIRRLRLA